MAIEIVDSPFFKNFALAFLLGLVQLIAGRILKYRNIQKHRKKRGTRWAQIVNDF
jgi:uncharacterized membrane protein HdeD (DUF308 family)